MAASPFDSGIEQRFPETREYGNVAPSKRVQDATGQFGTTGRIAEYGRYAEQSQSPRKAARKDNASASSTSSPMSVSRMIFLHPFPFRSFYSHPAGTPTGTPYRRFYGETVEKQRSAISVRRSALRAAISIYQIPLPYCICRGLPVRAFRSHADRRPLWSPWYRQTANARKHQPNVSLHVRLKFSHPPNVPYSLDLFLASPKKKGEKEGRRSARGRFFHESRRRRWLKSVPYERIRPHGVTMLDGIAWKNPHPLLRARE